MTRFAQALEDNPAPRKLGDVTLRYEPSMLIGETKRTRSSWVVSVVWVAALSCLLLAFAALTLTWGTERTITLLAASGIAFALANRLERHVKRQRRFVVNFATTSLRLDFSTPLLAHPRTMVVPFGAVRDVALTQQADGALCLLVDFVWHESLLCEVLVAYIMQEQRSDAERLERVLQGAFGLGTPPSDSAYFELNQGRRMPTDDRETSSFE